MTKQEINPEHICKKCGLVKKRKVGYCIAKFNDKLSVVYMARQDQSIISARQILKYVTRCREVGVSFRDLGVKELLAEAALFDNPVDTSRDLSPDPTE